MSDYPRWKYQGDKALVVDTPEAFEAFDGDWFDTPGEAKDAEIENPNKDVLIAQAAEIGVVTDKRWGVVRIQAAIDARIAEQNPTL
jgi:hypothetical protein